MKGLVLTLVASAMVVGCAAPADDVAVDSSKLARAVTTVDAKGIITDRATTQPIVGAKICVVGNTTLACGTSGADGSYSLQVPARSDVAILIKKDTHADTYLTFTTTELPAILGPLRVMDKAFDKTFHEQAGGERNATTGTLVVAFFDKFPEPTSAIAGVGLETAGGGGTPFYTDPNGLPSIALSETSTRGVAGLVNVRPGEVTMWLNHSSLQCVGSLGWTGSEPTEVRSQIFAGGTTVVYSACQ